MSSDVDGTAKRAARQRRDDLSRTSGLIGRRLRMANENAIAARRVADAGDIVGAFDDSELEPRHARWIVNLERRAQSRLPGILLGRGSLAPREGHLVRTRSDRNPRRRHLLVYGGLRDVDAFLYAELVILFAADFAREYGFVVDEDHKLVRNVVPLDAEVAFLDAAYQASGQHVLTVGGKRMRNLDPAPRAERQPIHVVVLRGFHRNTERDGIRNRFGVTDRHVRHTQRDR